MTRGKLTLAALLVVAIVAGVALNLGSGDGMLTSTDTRTAARADSLPANASSSARLTAPIPAPTAVPPTPPTASASAAVDPRVPAIDPPTPEPPPAQPWEIADPALYKAREKRLAQETNERFVQAADARLPPQLAAVDELRARNASQADIDRAEDKIRHLQAVRDTLVRGEPLVQDGLPPAALRTNSAATSPASSPASTP
jgi:hypothetical protein